MRALPCAVKAKARLGGPVARATAVPATLMRWRQRLGEAALARAWAGTMATNGAILVATLASGVATARLLGPHDRGLLATLMFWPGLIAGIGALGLSESAVTLMARPDRDRHLPAMFVGTANLAALAVALLGTAALLLATTLDVVPLAAAPPIVFLLIFATICANALNGVYHAEGSYRAYNLLRAAPALAYPALIGLLWLLGQATVTAILLAYLASFTAAGLAAHLLLRQAPLWPTRATGRLILSTGLRFHAAAMTMLLLQNLDRAVATLRLDPQEVGYYFVAQAWTAMAGAALLQPLRIVFLRHVSEEADEVLRRGRMRRALAAVVASVAAITLGSILVVGYLLPLVFGAAFVAAVPIAIVLQLAQAPLMIRSAIALFTPFIGQVRALLLADLAAILAFTGFCLLARGLDGVTLAAAQGVAQAVGLAVALLAPGVRALALPGGREGRCRG